LSLKTHIFKYEKIVIGGSLNAVLYAFMKDLPLIINDSEPPFPWEHWGLKYFDYFKFPFYREKFVVTPTELQIIGDYKRKIYNHLCFILSLGGKILFHKNIESIRIENDNALFISFDQNKVTKVSFKELIIFNSNKINGLIKEEKEIKDFMVVDWFNVKHGSEHELDLIETENKFINKIYFYPSLRTDGNYRRDKTRKDLVSISYLNEKEIKLIEYSELYAKLLIERIMKEHGIKGYKRGFQRDGITPRFSSLLIEHTEREVKEINNIKSQIIGNITYDSRTEEEILQTEECVNSYLLGLNQRLVQYKKKKNEKR
jgi:hypothetical protein